MGHSPWGHKELDTTEATYTHRALNSRNFSLTGLQADEAKADSLIPVFLFLEQG